MLRGESSPFVHQESVDRGLGTYCLAFLDLAADRWTREGAAGRLMLNVFAAFAQFELEIMRERATRIGATFTVSDREGRGTVVEVVIGGTDEPGVRARREGEFGAHDGVARR